MFRSKAETLEHLENVIRKAKILPQIRLEACDWNKSFLLREIEQRGWRNIPLIVRSSAAREDAVESSFAGHFTSITNITTVDELYESVERVISSFGSISDQDQVFIQPMLQSIRMSGVAFSYDPKTGAPYHVINYDEESGSTDTVTSGRTNALKVYYAHRSQREVHPEPIDKIIEMVEELESYFGLQALDVEFALTVTGELFLFQVRPLVVKKGEVSFAEHAYVLKNIASKIETLSRPHPYLYGSKNIFGIMPDWNPAEIIGVRPRPLALSLYKEIITDTIWAYQRDNYGYRDLRGFPLLVHFHGLPYIDVRVSFNSFIPSNLGDQLAEKLVNYYLNKLEEEPYQHDKVEFEIIYSCYTLDLPERLTNLKDAGFSPNEIELFSESLRVLTNQIVNPKQGLCSQDLQRIKRLEERFKTIQTSSLDIISKIYWLLEDCKRYGTLPFAGIARAAFIAVQFLKSFVHVQILSREELDSYLTSLNSICSQMQHDRSQLDREPLINQYGHLREGTYDIMSPRYDEAPDHYFGWGVKAGPVKDKKGFSLNLTQMEQIRNALVSHKLNPNVIDLFQFIQSAIEGREYSKFLFTRNLSEVFRLIERLGKEEGLTPEECSYLDIHDIKELYSCSLDIKSHLLESINRGKKLHACTKEIVLPPLITDPKDVWSFDLKQTDPNYITQRRITGYVCFVDEIETDIAGKIVMIPYADPGYDWIFSHHIAGLITMYGGVNSHMAVRVAELGIPGVIGAGEILYNRWSQAKILEINCENKTVRAIQ